MQRKQSKLSPNEQRLLEEIESQVSVCFHCKLSEEIRRCEYFYNKKCHKIVCEVCFVQLRQHIMCNCGETIEKHFNFKRIINASKNPVIGQACKMFKSQKSLRQNLKSKNLDNKSIGLMAYFQNHTSVISDDLRYQQIEKQFLLKILQKNASSTINQPRKEEFPKQ